MDASAIGRTRKNTHRDVGRIDSRKIYSQGKIEKGQVWVIYFSPPKDRHLQFYSLGPLNLDLSFHLAIEQDSLNEILSQQDFSPFVEGYSSDKTVPMDIVVERVL